MHQGWDDATGGPGDEPPAGAARPAEPAAAAARQDPQPEPEAQPESKQAAPETEPASGSEHEPGSPTEPEPGSEPEPEPAPEAEPVEMSQVLADLAEIERLAEKVMASPLWQHSNAQSVAGVARSAAAGRKLDAVRLLLLADMDGRVGTLPGAPSGYEARTYLRHGLLRTMGQAKADLAAAHALQPGADAGAQGLPRLGDAFRGGLGVP